MIHYYRYLLVKMKVFNYSQLNFSEVTSYKIPTLVIATRYFKFPSQAQSIRPKFLNNSISNYKVYSF